jgi:HxlR-like helix-turn-helix
MSPALLSLRLKELETAGIISRSASETEPGVFEYHLTRSGHELEPVIEAFGNWGQRWVDTELSLQHLDVSLLMWDMRRHLDATPMPARRSVIEFIYPELPPVRRKWWLLVGPEIGVDLCSVDPGFDVDLYVAADLRTMTAIWMGLDTVRRAQAEKRMTLNGDRRLAGDMQAWLGLSPFARQVKLAS